MNAFKMPHVHQVVILAGMTFVVSSVVAGMSSVSAARMPSMTALRRHFRIINQKNNRDYR
jgi:NCAIR mutase (PurE)-related protein